MNDQGPFAWLDAVQVLPADDGTGREVVSDGSGPIVRVSAQIADLLRALQALPAPRDADAVAAGLGGPWSGPEVVQVVERVRASSPRLTRPAGIVDVGRIPRFRRRSPGVYQLTILDPAPVLDRLPWVVALGRSRVVGAMLGLLAAVALAASALHVVAAPSSMDGLLGLGAYLGVIVLLYATTAVHELAHAVTVTAAGGRTHRMGLMFFYGVPAFFCDVTDAWRLDRRRRVTVALCGVLVQTAAAGAAYLVAPGLPVQARLALNVYAFSITAYGLLNLIPFVRLDGYVALAGFLDTPHLRELTMQSARDAWATRLFGAPRTTPARSWWVPFGFCAIVTPFVIGMAAAVAVDRYVAGLAGPALVVHATLLIAAVATVVVVLVRLVGHARAHGAGFGVAALKLVVPAVVLLAVVATVPFDTQERAGVTTVGDAAFLVLAPGVRLPPDGATVQVGAQGFGRLSPVSVGTVHARAHSCDVPVAAVAPLASPRLRIPSRCMPLSLEPAWSGDGAATFTVHSSLAARLSAPWGS